MNVLSCFDGVSCGQVALDRLGVKVDQYFASEIDKYPIKITQKNYPETIQLGCITGVKNIDLPEIDLLIGGSPCQGFSFSGKRLNFDDPRSKLFFEFEDLLKKLKPKYFLLENVMMDARSHITMSKRLGVTPIKINSALVSAQNRERYYWTNIPGTEKTLFGNIISQPEDKGIFLKDIVENGIVDTEKSYCLDASYYKGSQNGKLYLEKSRRQIVITEGQTVLHNLYGGFKEDFPRIFNEKSPTIRTAAGGGHIPSLFMKWCYDKKDIILKNRLLTPIECERLQTLKDNYTKGISPSQRYKALGNGWTVEVIVHILKGMDYEHTFNKHR